jgi:hypothetical protein
VRGSDFSVFWQAVLGEAGGGPMTLSVVCRNSFRILIHKESEKLRIQPKSCRLANVSVAALAKGGYLALQNDL